MLITATAFFAIALAYGIYLLSFVIDKKETPKGLALTHGFLASTGLIILIIYALLHVSLVWISIAVFVLAALGGLIVFHRDITGKELPIWMVLGHGTAAIIGFVLLIYFGFYY